MPCHSHSLTRVFLGVLLLSLPCTAKAQDQKPAPAGSISGRVLIDGKAAAGIPVAAVAGQSVNRRDAAARAVTDNEGQYVLRGLAPGQYQVWTLTPGFIVEPGASPNSFPFYGSIKSIFLDPNETVSNVDLKLIRGSVITGRITTLNDKPVVNEQVSLQLLDERGNPRLGAIGSGYEQMYQTDDRGVYRIYGLPPGRYRVSVGYDSANESFARGSHYEKTFYSDPDDEAKVGIVDLRAGDEATNINIKVKAPTSKYSVAGRVVDAETGLSIAKAGIRFALVNKNGGPPAPGIGIQADDRGEFSFSGFAAGQYSVYATSEIYGGNYYSDPVYFEVVDKDVSGIEIKTTPGIRVSGVVVAEGMSTKELLTLLPGLMVAVGGKTGTDPQLHFEVQSPIAPDGSFQVDGLRPGSASVFVGRLSPPLVRVQIVRVERDGVPLNATFDVHESMTGLRVSVDYGTGVIRGTVKFTSDNSITDARMYVSCKREGARDGPGTPVDARGNFLIKNLGEGTYEVTLQINVLTPRPPRPIPPQKQLIRVANGSESEANFVIDFAPGP